MDKFLHIRTLRNVCQKIWNMLGLSEGANKNGIRALDAPIQMSNYTIESINDTASIWLNGTRDDSTSVCQKKLQKAEDKIKQKQEKRQMIETTKPPSGLAGQECQASAAQVSLACSCGFGYLGWRRTSVTYSFNLILNWE